MAVQTLRLDGSWQVADLPPNKGETLVPFDGRSPGGIEWIEARVPGDIHIDLLKAGRIEDPYVGDNVEKCTWTTQRDWWFRRSFHVPARIAARKHVELVFEGIDTFGTVWLNGVRLGGTDNMFRPFRFDIRGILRADGPNHLVVRVGATTPIIEKNPWKTYFACFYTPRIFARKAQCHFSWDWAPHLPALGIWRGVRIEAWDPGRITETFVRPSNDGRVLIQLTLDERPRRPDADDEQLTDTGERELRRPGGTYRIRIAGPGCDIETTAKVQGQKSFVNLRVPNPKLWWPNGHGEPHLYRYRIDLVRKGRTRDRVEGTFGFREIEIDEKPLGNQALSFTLRINGRKIFCKGANWVPPDCFPGTIPPGRYERLLTLACDAHFNMLRVWGGGIYEDDRFYDLCDRHGLMVWQDFMFACSDYPDGNPDFLRNVAEEAAWQVRRLRNHPSVVYWCGGNEKTGSAGFNVSHGDRIFEEVIPGITRTLDPTRPYRPASPHSLTDLGNDRHSGDTHASCFEDAFVDDLRRFREHIRRIDTVFNSEFGLHGPVRWRSLRRFIPDEHLWPVDDVWELHVQDNPYNTLPETFVQVQMKAAERLFGPLDGVRDFLKKGMAVHAEILREEFENHRRRKFWNSGAMYWMFNDTWPAGSWASVDYYGLPKPVYYAARRACSPLLLSICRSEDGKRFEIRAINDLPRDLSLTVRFGIETVTGKRPAAAEKKIRVPDNGVVLVGTLPAKTPWPPDAYVYAEVKGKPETGTTWFPELWHEVPWPDPRVEVSPLSGPEKTDGGWLASFRVRTRAYARYLHLDLPGDEENFYSDNFFDLRPGRSRTITVRSPRRIRIDRVKTGHWLTEWN